MDSLPATGMLLILPADKIIWLEPPPWPSGQGMGHLDHVDTMACGRS